MQTHVCDYGTAILQGFEYLLNNYEEVFVIGQGLWSPWYVGNTMTNLEKKYGETRIIDTPVSESACTGAAVGASLAGMKPVVVHPRMDFMLYAMDAIVNQAAKWSHMTGGQAHPSVTIRGIINRGGEQGAQHSQALHSWFAHVPGLRVVMPYSVKDARDLLIASVLCDDPVVYIDDRWLYEDKDVLVSSSDVNLADQVPRVIREGADITLVGASYSTKLCMIAAKELQAMGISAEVIDLRVVNPLNTFEIVQSVTKTKRLLVVDGSWGTCGLAGEVIASVVEKLPRYPVSSARITLPDAPAPTSKVLEEIYYPSEKDVVAKAINLMQ